MGGNQSKHQQILKLVASEWEVCPSSQGLTILRNLQTLKEAEVCLLALDPIQDIAHEYQIYNERRVQEEGVVEVYAVQELKAEATICGNQPLLKVLVQRVFIRLDQIKQLSFSQALYVLSESIRGYHYMFQRIGFFNITADMICLNTKRQIKVWLNSNLAKNHPIDQRPGLQTTQQTNPGKMVELIMLHNLISIVESKCQYQKFPQDLRPRIYAQYHFIDAYTQISQYCAQRQIIVPPNLMQLYWKGQVGRSHQGKQNFQGNGETRMWSGGSLHGIMHNQGKSNWVGSSMEHLTSLK